MAANTKNKFPADKAGSKYADFRNTRRFTEHKTNTAEIRRQQGGNEPSQKNS